YTAICTVVADLYCLIDLYISLHAQAGSLVKLGAWGGDHGGKEYDVTVAPQRLEGFWLRYGKVIDCISSPTSTRTRTSTPSAPGAAKAASPSRPSRSSHRST
ncbi:Os03g0399900, partial [Oryza sativa Japonica Group]